MKYVFFQQYEDTPAMGIPYNIVDSHNTEHPGFPKKGEYYNTHVHMSMTYYLNDDETRMILNTGTILELDAKIKETIDEPIGHIAFEQGFIYIDTDIYLIEGTKDIYTFDMLEAYLYCKIKNNILQGLNIDNIVLDESPIPADAITWYKKPTPEDNTYHISDAFKRLINKLGITSDNKIKLINAIEFCCTKIRDGEDPDDPHIESQPKTMFVFARDTFAEIIGITKYTFVKNAYPDFYFKDKITFEIEGQQFNFAVNESITEYEEIQRGPQPMHTISAPCAILPFKTINVTMDISVLNHGPVEDDKHAFEITWDILNSYDNNSKRYGIKTYNNLYFFSDPFYIENGVLKYTEK